MYTQTLAIIFDHIQQPQWLLITVDQAWKKISWKTNQAEFLLSISLLKKILLKNLAVCKPAFHSGAPRAKRASGTPWVNKTTHPRKFGNHVTDRPSVRTTGVPMFTLTLSSYFGSPLIAHQCCDQLTAVKTRYPLTSITWPYRGLRCRPIEVEYF